MLPDLKVYSPDWSECKPWSETTTENLLEVVGMIPTLPLRESLLDSSFLRFLSKDSGGYGGDSKIAADVSSFRSGSARDSRAQGHPLKVLLERDRFVCGLDARCGTGRRLDGVSDADHVIVAVSYTHLTLPTICSV